MEASFTFTPMESTLEVFLLSRCNFGRWNTPCPERAQNHNTFHQGFYQNDEKRQYFSINLWTPFLMVGPASNMKNRKWRAQGIIPKAHQNHRNLSNHLIKASSEFKNKIHNSSILKNSCQLRIFMQIKIVAAQSPRLACCFKIAMRIWKLFLTSIMV